VKLRTEIEDAPFSRGCDDGRFVLLRGITAAEEAMWGDSQDEKAEVHSLEVVCLRFAP